MYAMPQCGNISLIGCNRTVVYEVPDSWTTSHVRSIQFSRRTDVRHRGSIREYTVSLIVLYVTSGDISPCYVFREVLRLLQATHNDTACLL